MAPYRTSKKRPSRLEHPLFFEVFGLILFLGLSLLPPSAYANNLSISNVSLKDCNVTSDTINVEFDVSWENAWKDEINNDAVWVFIKYSKDGGTTWYHASITSASYTPTGASITIASDYKGVFIQPANYGSGTQSYTDVKLSWAYGLDGVSDAEVVHSTNSKVKVFGIEMVYIPAGGFYAGDTSSTSTLKQGSSDTKPWFIPNENAIHCTDATSGGYYYVTDSQAHDDATGTDFWIPQDFPKGYKAIYMMKYEISQQQWIDFFNTLTSTQKPYRDITSSTDSGKNSDSVVNRNTVSYSSGDATVTRGPRACNFLSWKDLCAYAAWAALRPMTELEFEKAARGPLAAVSGEYAWGTASSTYCSAISGTEDGTEYCSTSTANCTYGNRTFTGGDGGTGPTRVGIYARSTTATARESAGAGFYGNLDLSGNLWERVVTVGNSTGRAFVGSHGDGTLSTTYGQATNPDWPGYSGGEVLAATGSGLRGASWYDTTAGNLSISNRANAGYAVATRGNRYGGRCVRTAP